MVEHDRSQITIDESPVPSPKVFIDNYEDESSEERQFEEGTIEAKPYEELTEEERVLVSAS
jgi:hypothetical protein